MRRRELLRLAGLGAMAGIAQQPPVACFPAARAQQGSAFSPDVDLSLTAAPDEVGIRPGTPTRVWRYTGQVISGPADSLEAVPGSYLGPTIRLRRGQKVRIRFTNQLPEPSIVQWHGLDVPERADGHPRFTVRTGQTYVYEFEVVNRPGTYWYHPHPHMRTGFQVYQGLAGLLIVSDDGEAALGLPSGSGEILCVLQDRSFDRANQLVYVSGMPMDRMGAFLGDRVLVNGQEQPSLNLATRAYRLRLLNGSSSRIYKLGWDDETPMSVIGSDGGLLEQPVVRPYVTLAPAERADLVLDLGARPVGGTLGLRSLAFSGVEAEMGMGRAMGMGRRGVMMRGGLASVPNGAPLSLLTIRVARRERSDFRLPARLSTFDASWRSQDAGRRPSRTFTMRIAQMQWLLNDRTFEMTAVAPNETITLGVQEIWEFANLGGGMMQMPHPIHLHGGSFRVLRRTMDDPRAGAWQDLRDGLTEEQGWKDTALVMPGERVQLLVQFRRYTGLYLYHCHNLEHEDMGMMRNFRVVG